MPALRVEMTWWTSRRGGLVRRYPRRMRIALLAVFAVVVQTASLRASTCITGPLDVRQANVIAVARYAGDREFTVESILRTLGERPSKLVAPEDWRSSPCAPPAPDRGAPAG